MLKPDVASSVVDDDDHVQSLVSAKYSAVIQAGFYLKSSRTLSLNCH